MSKEKRTGDEIREVKGGEGRSWNTSQRIERISAFTLNEKGSLWKVSSREVPRSDLGLRAHSGCHTNGRFYGTRVKAEKVVKRLLQ